MQGDGSGGEAVRTFDRRVDKLLHRGAVFWGYEQFLVERDVNLKCDSLCGIVNTTGFKFAMELDENGKAADGLGCDLCGSNSTNFKGGCESICLPCRGMRGGRCSCRMPDGIPSSAGRGHTPA
jgi:hypothetical protein